MNEFFEWVHEMSINFYNHINRYEAALFNMSNENFDGINRLFEEYIYLKGL